MRRQFLIVTVLLALLATAMWLAASDRGLAAGSNASQLSKPADKSELLLTGPGIAPQDKTAWNTSESRGIVWDNGMNYDGILTAQKDPVEGLFSEPADDFMFSVDQVVRDVHWIGGYFNGPPDDGDFDWEITFRYDNGFGTEPGAYMTGFTFANADVNETLISGSLFSYSVVLPTPLTFTAGMKYWIIIQGLGEIPPQSAWAYHEAPIQLHEASFRSAYFGFPFWTDISDVLGISADMCFQLTDDEEPCSWNPGNPYKMHYPQLPDTTGWDVAADHGLRLADDWLCTESGFVKDIHFWGSWKDGIENEHYFVFIIYSDIPAGTDGIPYSRPGNFLWSNYGADVVEEIPLQSESWEGWYNPETGEYNEFDHQQYYQYNVCIDTNWFYQEEGTVYWLLLGAQVIAPEHWGWKSSQSHWNNNAVFSDHGSPWVELYDPITSATA